MVKKGQQEMVGFVLIVVLVMVGLMVFLVISVRDSGESGESVRVSNMLGVLMKATSDCENSRGVDYYDYKELFKSCYKDIECSNLNRSACDYLNESLVDVIDALVESEANVESYEIEFFVKEGEGILKWSEGNCSGQIIGAQESFSNLIVRLRLCMIN